MQSPGLEIELTITWLKKIQDLRIHEYYSKLQAIGFEMMTAVRMVAKIFLIISCLLFLMLPSYTHSDCLDTKIVTGEICL